MLSKIHSIRLIYILHSFHIIITQNFRSNKIMKLYILSKLYYIRVKIHHKYFDYVLK